MTHTATAFSEADWEGLALEQLAELGWRPMHGEDIAPGTGERDSWDELLIRPRLLNALWKFNPSVPEQYLQQGAAEIAVPKSQDAVTENHRLHSYLVDGFRGISFIDSDGSEANPTLRLISADEDANDWLAAFYGAVAQNESAVQVQGEGILADIARELVSVMRRDIRTDWTVRDDVRAAFATTSWVLPISGKFESPHFSPVALRPAIPAGIIAPSRCSAAPA